MVAAKQLRSESSAGAEAPSNTSVHCLGKLCREVSLYFLYSPWLNAKRAFWNLVPTKLRQPQETDLQDVALER